MRKLLLTLALLSVLPTASVLAAAKESPSQQADRAIENISDAKAFVAEIDRSLQMAREGVYGTIKPSDMTRMDDSRNTIARLLDGHENATELSPDERIELYNAQELISSIIRDDDKGRKVCMRIKEIGTRITKRECLTVAEREQRARDAKESAAEMLRTDCVPGEVSRCGIIRGSGDFGT